MKIIKEVGVTPARPGRFTVILPPARRIVTYNTNRYFISVPTSAFNFSYFQNDDGFAYLGTLYGCFLPPDVSDPIPDYTAVYRMPFPNMCRYRVCMPDVSAPRREELPKAVIDAFWNSHFNDDDHVNVHSYRNMPASPIRTLETWAGKTRADRGWVPGVEEMMHDGVWRIFS